MQKPDLDKMWETFIEVGGLSYYNLYDTLRFKIHPLVSDLKQKKIIDWYCFLIHNRKSGVPATEDDNKAYWHIRFTVKKDINPKDFLPEYCVLTRRVERERVADISIGKDAQGDPILMDKSLIRNGEIEEAWRIIGEQSEWVLSLLDIYRKDARITPLQVSPFLHYFANITQLDVRLR